MRTKSLHFRQKSAAIATDKPSSGLNISPLIDGLPVLLIMLMLSIPAATHNVSMDLSPRSPGASAALASKFFLHSAGTAIWNDSPMDSVRLRVRLEMMTKAPAKSQLHFKSDARAR